MAATTVAVSLGAELVAPSPPVQAPNDRERSRSPRMETVSSEPKLIQGITQQDENVGHSAASVPAPLSTLPASATIPTIPEIPAIPAIPIITEQAAETHTSSEPRARSRSPPRAAECGSSVPLYSDVHPASWVARMVGKNQMGSPTVCVYDSTTRESPLFCLYKGDECGTLVFSLEPRKDAERPAFMTGGDTSKKVEGLDLSITLEGEQLEFVRSADERCKQLALENSKDWFGRTCTSTEIDVMYNSPIKVDETGRWAPHIRAKMNLGGIDKYLTQVTYVRANGTPDHGCGWEFVEPRLGEQKWRGHRARVVIEARRLWIVGRKFGLTYTITDIAVREKPEKRATPFTCDNSVECLGALPA